MSKQNKNYVAGIDVGTHSVGMTAIEIDEYGDPIKLLSCVSHIHDSGIDPDSNKSAITRLAASGVARRTRRLYRRNRRRLKNLDSYLESLGWPVPSLEDFSDPYLPWKVRAELAVARIDNPAQRHEKLSIAIRHIARHRGWRNPYSKMTALKAVAEPSAAYETIRSEISKATGHVVPPGATVGQMVALTSLGKYRLRGEGGLLSARLQQSDHANEIHEIAAVQELASETTRELIEYVFAAESPKGSAAGRAGKDPLQPHLTRALKASDAFQRYRIAALTGNLRLKDSDAQRPLTKEERRLISNHLVELKPKTEATWDSVAQLLDVDRGSLRGTATPTDDGERASTRPPVHDTNRTLLGSTHKPLAKWWMEADAPARAVMINALSNGATDDFDSQEGAQVQQFFLSLSDEESAKLDSIHLPIGRAAYSEDTLTRLTRRMLEDNLDLHEARRIEFGVSDTWTPPSPPIGEAVGNPAVDRVLKTVARWLNAAENQWGAPASVNIEHTRDAFVSESKTRQIERDQQKRGKRNAELLSEMQAKLGIEGRVRRADLWRYQSIQRQNGQCAYCGSFIDFKTAEMDHIIPRAGQGSTNKRENLVATCHRCNLSKGNTPFARWAESCGIAGVSVAEAKERTRHWLIDPGLTNMEFRRFVKNVTNRLERVTIDEEIDARSIESVAWMANELRARIHHHFSSMNPGGTKVRVFRGHLTAEARRAAGITEHLRFIDGAGKSRLDRRHHAVDAAIIALLSQMVAEVLTQRSNLKFEQELRRVPAQWKEFTGADAAHRAQFSQWKSRMHKLGMLLQKALDEDRVAVTSNIRLRLGNGAAHEDTIRKLERRAVGSAFTIDQIDRASSEALWCALTRQPDFDPREGLPENPDRKIRINSTHLTAEDEVTLFTITGGAIAVRGGFAEISRFHHARIYRIPLKKGFAYSMLRVYNIDLQQHRHKDLFNAELPPQTMSVRQAEPKLRQSLQEGTAEYLGWIVVDDELLITDMAAVSTGQVENAQKELGEITRWRVDGFFTKTQLRLRPLLLSAEGIRDEASPDVKKVLDRPGWLPAINKLFGAGAVVVRRDSIGRVRLTSNAHLPTTWKA